MDLIPDLVAAMKAASNLRDRTALISAMCAERGYVNRSANARWIDADREYRHLLNAAMDEPA